MEYDDYINSIERQGKHIELSSVHSGRDEGVDLALTDEKGNIGVVFQDGHIRTKNFDSSCFVISPLFERGGITSGGYDSHSISYYESMVRTALFIDVAGSEYIEYQHDFTLFEYNSSFALIRVTLLNSGLSKLTEECKYIRILSRDSDVLRLYMSKSTPREVKRVQMRQPSDALIYEVDENVCTTARLMLPPNYTIDGDAVPLIVWDSGDGSFTTWNSYEMGGGGNELRLKGIEYLRDQGFAVLEIYSWGSYYYNKYRGCGSRSAMPIPTHIATHDKGVEYVISRYNISSENIFHLSKSGSGKIALYYALVKPKFNLKAIYAFAPVFDDLNFSRWGMPDYRKALFDELNLEGTEEQICQFRDGYDGDTVHHGWLLTRGPYSGTIDDETLAHLHEINQDFVRKNISKFTTISVSWMNLIGQSPEEKFKDTLDWGYKFWETDKSNWDKHESVDDSGKYPVYNRNTDVYNRHDLTMIGNHIPIKVVMSKNDEQTPYWSALEVVNQLRNGGTDATIYPLTTQGHSAPDMGSGVNAITDVTTRLGIHYDSVSIGWVIACEDIFNRFLKK